jgi:hypothetical protein
MRRSGGPVKAIRNCVLLVSGLVPLLAVGCVDAPITQNQLEEDGTLRLRGHEQSAFSAHRGQSVRQAIQVSAVLAAEDSGPLEDRNAFSADVKTIHLHVRADGLLEPRPVEFRWTHPDLTVSFDGELGPSDSMSLGASLDIDPELVGHWEVEVLTKPETPGEAPRVLFHREFEVDASPLATL